MIHNKSEHDKNREILTNVIKLKSCVINFTFHFVKLASPEKPCWMFCKQSEFSVSVFRPRLNIRIQFQHGFKFVSIN